MEDPFQLLPKIRIPKNQGAKKSPIQTSIRENNGFSKGMGNFREHFRPSQQVLHRVIGVEHFHPGIQLT